MIFEETEMETLLLIVLAGLFWLGWRNIKRNLAQEKRRRQNERLMMRLASGEFDKRRTP
jgi:hypothetical protein